MSSGGNRTVESLVVGLQEHPAIAQRLATVLHSLPDEVVEDFLSDDTFTIQPERVTKAKSTTMFMACPTGRNVSRCVILREKLTGAKQDFAHYVIAHELAHAFLRNGGWGEIADREEAADALAAHWGYARPARVSILKRK